MAFSIFYIYKKGFLIMKKRRPMGMTGMILIIIVVSVILTGIILVSYLAKNAVAKNDDKILENAYLTVSEPGTITLYCDGSIYEYEGILEEDFTGVADVVISNEKIQKIYAKPDCIDGILISYTDTVIEVQGFGELPKGEDVPVYSLISGGVQEVSFDTLVVGNSSLTYVMEEGHICTIIQKERTRSENIRVLITKKGSAFHSDMYVTASADFVCGSENKTAGTWINMKEVLKDTSKAVDLTCEKGMLIICNGSSAPESLSQEKMQTICNGDGNFSTGKAYPGQIRIRKEDEGFVVVNEVAIEEYICYVLPSEMPLTFSYEALKAQAVCARTVAYSQMKNDAYASYGANLDDTVSYQAYNSAGTGEMAKTVVAETKGQVLSFDGDLMECFYFSTSPGYTENLEVWGKEDSPDYLTVKSSITQKDYTLPAELSTSEGFSAFIHSAPASFDSESPYFRWKAVISLAAGADSELGKMTGIQITKRSNSGYAVEMKVNYEEDSRTYSGEGKIRNFLGRCLTTLTLNDGSVRENFSTLPSSCFEVTATGESSITLTGGGFGHGIGMSQYGADAMGDAGFTYNGILSFYYTDSKIKLIGELAY